MTTSCCGYSLNNSSCENNSKSSKSNPGETMQPTSENVFSSFTEDAKIEFLGTRTCGTSPLSSFRPRFTSLYSPCSSIICTVKELPHGNTKAHLIAIYVNEKFLQTSVENKYLYIVFFVFPAQYESSYLKHRFVYKTLPLDVALAQDVICRIVHHLCSIS